MFSDSVRCFLIVILVISDYSASLFLQREFPLLCGTNYQHNDIHQKSMLCLSSCLLVFCWILQHKANKITLEISSLCTVASRLNKKFSAFIEGNLTVIFGKRDSITHSFQPPRLWLMSPSDVVHSLPCVKQRWTLLLCCLFPCQRLQSLEQDESSLSASRTHDCTETKAAGRLCKELTASEVNYPTTCRL